jgi:hypothetical protein
MSKGKSYCNCLTCESIYQGALDYRGNANRGKTFKPVICQLCLKIRTKKELARDDGYYGIVHKPDSLKKFLGLKWLCDHCIGGIGNNVRRTLRSCWNADPEVLQLAVCMMIKHQLVSEANKATWMKQTLTRAIKNGEDYSNWPWINQQMVDEATQRITQL